jgi:hypothetical protein
MAHDLHPFAAVLRCQVSSGDRMLCTMNRNESAVARQLSLVPESDINLHWT